MQMKLKLLTILIFLFFSTELTSGQCPPTYIYDGEAAGDWFGQWVASAGDVNNDGYDDFIIGCPVQ